MKWLRFSASLVIGALIAGCASSDSGDVYSRDQVRRTQTVQLGTVLQIKNVKIEGTKSGVGTVAGAVAGGVAGSTIGAGSGRTLAALGGAALGAVGGTVAEEQLTKKTGIEITVKLDSGSTIAVVQEADIMFSVGERVRVLTSGGITRVTK
ncbi:MAG: glycine zipper 2TM domain-containing protein [Kiritimatiellaceae bacterium]|nr:glycine zipper 2TM domain-containing protein [Kiritimatiellaceae bacterium]